MAALESLRGLIVIDEVQRHPDLFPILRVLLDRKPVRARFLTMRIGVSFRTDLIHGHPAMIQVGHHRPESLVANRNIDAAFLYIAELQAAKSDFNGNRRHVRRQRQRRKFAKSRGCVA